MCYRQEAEEGNFQIKHRTRTFSSDPELSLAEVNNVWTFYMALFIWTMYV